MSEQSDPSLTAIPENFREITWEIGEAELQKSVMAKETFEALRNGQTSQKDPRQDLSEAQAKIQPI